MLMDEPFGAIDPINRARLQDEFLRLQAQVRKTVVFVTHDIDEAIKMGDRIAILREGGRARAVRDAGGDPRPTRPTSSSREFVGADRALKRLGLTHARRGRAAAAERPAGAPASRVAAHDDASATRCRSCWPPAARR